jgi:DNA-binding PadR family transcriptional regulator
MTNIAKTENKFWVRDRLQEIQNGESTLSRALKENLVELGLLAPKFVKVNEGTRGRPMKVYELSGKGRGYLGLSKSWKRDRVNPETMTRGELETEVLFLREELAKRMEA